MKPRGVHHVSLEVADVEKAAAFYTEVLGLEVVGRPNPEFPGIWLRSEGQEVHLMYREGFQGPEGQQFGQHFALRVDDAEAVVQELDARGVRCTRPIAAPAGGWSVFLRDPSGNLVELNQPPS